MQPAMACQRVPLLLKLVQPVQIRCLPIPPRHHQQGHRLRSLRQQSQNLTDLLAGFRHHIVDGDQSAWCR